MIVLSLGLKFEAMGNKILKTDLSEINWHSLSVEASLQQLETDAEGLSDSIADERREEFGFNEIPSGKKVTLLKIILHQLINPLIFILIVAAIASIVIDEVEDSFFIFLVIALNTVLGTYQEYKAEKSASSLQKLLRIQAHVKRSGKIKILDAGLLVPGDIVLLESGNKVPADLRIIYQQSLSADESFLTGESIASQKTTEILPKETQVSDQKNIAFAGATINSGRATGVVISTGYHTQVGQIARKVAHAQTAKPPLVLRMEKFTHKISLFIVALSFFLGILLRLQGYEYEAIFFYVVALAVSAIPEGLPVALTVALSIATRRMAKRNVIVRKLTAVESLGSCTVIASDKTGTLTVNQQTVKKIKLPNGSIFNITGEGYNDAGEALSESDAPVSNENLELLKHLALLSIFTNEASLVKNDQEWEHTGDAMDLAILSLGYKLGIDPEEVRKSYTSQEQIPYESEQKYSAARYSKEDQVYTAVKGAVETVLQFCKEQMAPEGVQALDSDSILQQAEKMAESGLRILAIAGKTQSAESSITKFEDSPGDDLILYGLMGFIDPLRPEAGDAIKKCKKAGIKVIMITGDHPITASAIAQEIEIIEKGDKVISGKDLTQAGEPDSDAFRDKVQSASVFARVSPIQKYQIVDALIHRGEFVAVTGDGVNDTPAMRRANIGVAMGSGTDAAKETGSMIITDDNFSSIVSGVEEGRFAYDNVRKVIYLLISCGAAEVALFLIAIFANLPMPLLAVQLLWLNLVTNGIQDVALAFEAGEPGAMKRKPRKPNERIFNPLMLQQTIISGLFMGLMAFGFWFVLIEIMEVPEYSARNMVLLLMVLQQNVHVLNCRSETTSAFRISFNRNYVLMAGICIAQGLHVLSMQIPFMQKLLKLEPVSWKEWVLILFMSITLLGLMEGYKWFKKQFLTPAV